MTRSIHHHWVDPGFIDRVEILSIAWGLSTRRDYIRIDLILAQLFYLSRGFNTILKGIELLAWIRGGLQAEAIPSFKSKISHSTWENFER